MESIDRTCKHHGIVVPFSNARPLLGTMLNSPQQEHDSLDCGVAVCYVIRQFYRQQPIDTKPAETEIRVMRTKIVEMLVCSWS